ncbi:MAG: N-terminal cleavage protein [Verrucomicrobiales bacterium]|nr:N-terminal cleavage protein [Verrucomicrobiales bacterium]
MAIHRTKVKNAFTLLELLVVVGCIGLLTALALPLLGRARSNSAEAACMNNLGNLDRAFLTYSDQNQGLVPQEGNIGKLISDPVNAAAWYNVAVQPEYPAMTNLYNSGNYPLPGNGSVYSCPLATMPISPSKSYAFFMYGENDFICVNASDIALGAPQTRINLVTRPSQTIYIGEVLATPSSPSLSGVTANYAAIRHNGFGMFAMTDGSVQMFTTNEFNHNYSGPASEWFANGVSGAFTNRACYWWPTPNTP